jgi:hypothetical protein
MKKKLSKGDRFVTSPGKSGERERSPIENLIVYLEKKSGSAFFEDS